MESTDAPLPLPQFQKVAGRQDIATTMRYIHSDGIEHTTSRQWSREKIRALDGRTLIDELPIAKSGLRVIVGGLT